MPSTPSSPGKVASFCSMNFLAWCSRKHSSVPKGHGLGPNDNLLDCCKWLRKMLKPDMSGFPRNRESLRQCTSLRLSTISRSRRVRGNSKSCSSLPGRSPRRAHLLAFDTTRFHPRANSLDLIVLPVMPLISIIHGHNVIPQVGRRQGNRKQANGGGPFFCTADTSRFRPQVKPLCRY